MYSKTSANHTIHVNLCQGVSSSVVGWPCVTPRAWQCKGHGCPRSHSWSDWGGIWLRKATTRNNLGWCGWVFTVESFSLLKLFTVAGSFSFNPTLLLHSLRKGFVVVFLLSSQNCRIAGQWLLQNCILNLSFKKESQCVAQAWQ